MGDAGDGETHGSGAHGVGHGRGRDPKPAWGRFSFTSIPCPMAYTALKETQARSLGCLLSCRNTGTSAYGRNHALGRKRPYTNIPDAM